MRSGDHPCSRFRALVDVDRVGQFPELVRFNLLKLPQVEKVYLESQMFEKMSSSIGLVRLSPATSIDPDPHGRGLGPWRVFSGDLKSDQYNVASLGQIDPTVKPLESVVLSVLEGVMGLAYRLRGDWMEARALRFRSERWRFSASRWVAIVRCWKGESDS